MRSVLKLAAYRRLLAAYTLNELAWSVGSLALALLVYRRTGSAAGATGFFLSAQFVPALLSPALVARLDQRSAREVLPVLYGLEGLAFLALAYVATHFSLVPALVLAMVDGAVALTARAIARAATVAVTAPAGLLREGNALTNTAFSVCLMTGPAIGGVVVVAGGTSVALLANGGLFALIALTLASSGMLPAAAPERSPVAGRLRAALAEARHRPAIRVLLSLQGAALLFFTMSIPVEIVFAQRTLHAGAAGYGVMLAFWGGGAVAGSAIYARWRALPARILIAVGAGSLGVGFLVMAVAPTIAVAVAGATLGGAGNGIEAVAARTTLQEHVEQQWMALMMSLNESVAQAVPGAGIFLGGAMTALAGPRIALGVAGGGALVITGIVWLVLSPGGGVLEPIGPESRPSDVNGARTSRAEVVRH